MRHCWLRGQTHCWYYANMISHYRCSTCTALRHAERAVCQEYHPSTPRGDGFCTMEARDLYHKNDLLAAVGFAVMLVGGVVGALLAAVIAHPGK